MEVQENYILPFESEYDWRAALFNIIKDIATESAIEILTKYKKSDSELEWKDDEGLVNFAFDQDMFAKIHALMEEKATSLLI